MNYENQHNIASEVEGITSSSLLANEVNIDELMSDADQDSTSSSLISLLPSGKYLVLITDLTTLAAKDKNGFAVLFNGKPRLGAHQITVQALYDINRSKRVSAQVRGTAYEFSSSRMALMDDWSTTRGRVLASLAVVSLCQTGRSEDGSEYPFGSVYDFKKQALEKIRKREKGFTLQEIYSYAKNCYAVVNIKESPERVDGNRVFEARNEFSPQFIDPPSAALYEMAMQWATE